MPSGRMSLGQCCSATRFFRRFYSMGYATEFHQNRDAVCITKASNQNPSQQSSKASSSLSPLLVAFNGECPRATSLQLASLMEELNRHKGAILRASSVPCILPSLRRFLGHGAYEGELRPPHKHHLRLVLFCVPFSIARFCKVIRFLYGFGCGKVEAQQQMLVRIRIAVR